MHKQGISLGRRTRSILREKHKAKTIQRNRKRSAAFLVARDRDFLEQSL